MLPVRPALTGIRRALMFARYTVRPPKHALCHICLQASDGPWEACVYVRQLNLDLLSLCKPCRQATSAADALPFYLSDLRLFLRRLQRTKRPLTAAVEKAVMQEVAEAVVMGNGASPLALRWRAERNAKEQALRRERALAHGIRPAVDVLRKEMNAGGVEHVALNFTHATACTLSMAIAESDAAGGGLMEN